MLNNGANVNYWDVFLCFRLFKGELYFLITSVLFCRTL